MAVNYYDLLLQEDINLGVGTGTRRNPGGGTLTGTQVGLHTLAVGQAAVAQTWDPGSVGSLTAVTTTVSVPGAALGDFVLASFSLNRQGLLISGEVTSSNVVTVTLFNPTAAAVDLASGTVKVLVLKSR